MRKSFTRKSVIYFLSVFTLFLPALVSAQLDTTYLNQLKHNHDLVSLPEWGGYTKNYIGVSHISDAERGIRFDLSVFPGYYRRKIEVPNVNFETGYHPWETSANLDYYSFRHELEWKDQVYTDISYSKIDDHSRLIRVEAVNNTEFPQSIVLHLMGSIHFPPVAPYAPNNALNAASVQLPSKGIWLDAVDYAACDFVTKRPTDNLVRLGMMQGEYRMHDFVDGAGIHLGEKGDKLHYELAVDKDFENAVLVLRYRPKEMVNSLKIKMNDKEQELLLDTKNEIFTKEIEVGKLEKGTVALEVINEEGKVDLDGFAFIEKSAAQELTFIPANWDYKPEITELPESNAIIIKYKNIDTYYGVRWSYEDYEVREWFFDDLSHEFRRRVHNHVHKKLYDGDSEGHFTNVFMRPIPLAPQSKEVLYAYAFSGSKAAVMDGIKSVEKLFPEEIHDQSKSMLIDYEEEVLEAGKPYILSNRILAANTLGNIVYPIYTQKQYIKHYSPGRFWDILYTWDSGFTGIGLAQLDIKAAIELLNTYVNEPDEQSAFIQHGSFVPVQHYLFKEIWDKTQSEEYLQFFYPKLKYYYDFYVGKSGSSTTANLSSGLLQTWDYFYNSGGWDDYPPQKATRGKEIVKRLATASNTAHGIRIAKIMKQVAAHLGKKGDIKAYDADIEKLENALQANAWDETAGYYGYVLHDEQKNAQEIFKYEDGTNFNMGMDGAYPLVSDIGTTEQKEILLEKVKTEGKIWSKIGLSAVDQSAPYYSREGYWNGSVWMPHQWFFWKAMFDYGEDDFAFKIAKTALDLWKKETDRTYNSYEHFMIETETGAGWHHFSGLSTPVLAWFTAYYRKGNLTTGYNAWIKSKEWNADKSELKASLELDYEKGEKFSMVAVMNPEFEYQVLWNGKEVEYKTFHKGTLSITLEGEKKRTGVLEIKRR